MGASEFPDKPADHALISQVITTAKTIAVVGISRKPEAVSRMVAEYMSQHGYTIIPVNPVAEEIMGEKCYHSLADIPFPVDVIDVFRKPNTLVELAEKIIAMPHKPKTVWFQLGIANNEAAKIIEDAGINIIQSRCIKIEHGAIGGRPVA